MARVFETHFTRDDGTDVTVSFHFDPGSPPITHLAPEDCDPGSGPETELVKVVDDIGAAVVLTEAEEARVLAEIESDPPEDDGPDPDDLRDMAIDDAWVRDQFAPIEDDY